MVKKNVNKVALIRKMFSAGTRVEVVPLGVDGRGSEDGIKGTVLGVGDDGSLMMRWEDEVPVDLLQGSASSKAQGGAATRIKASGSSKTRGSTPTKAQDSVKTICYGREEVWNSRKEAINYFLEAIVGTDGSERDRYTDIYLQLMSGKMVCSDQC